MMVLLTFGTSQAGAQDASVPPKPNIVLIITDDMAAWDLRFMPKTKTLLTSQGTRFSRAYVTYSLCCPSRATILRGQYAHNHTIYDNSPPDGAAPKFRSQGLEESTVATWLDEAGYRTGHVGKYMNAYDGDYIPPGWDSWHTLYGYHPNTHTINDNGNKNTYSAPVDSALELRVKRFLGASSTAPFYLQVGTHGPHNPHEYPPEYEDLYKDLKAPRYRAFNEADVSDKPRWIRARDRFDARQVAWVDENYRGRLRALRDVDDLVGEVVGTLREQGDLENTYIVFTSDNGWHYGEHRLQGKWSPYENAVRVPMVVRGPGCRRTRNAGSLRLTTTSPRPLRSGLV
jgi:arylsulfatase A-like enzyme